MKKQSLQFLTRILCSAILAITLNISAFAYPGGAPAGYTGSPGDGQHCVSCHGGSAATVTGWITSNIPAAGYTAGTAYTITVTVSGTGKKGFEVSPQNATGVQLGVLAAGTGNHTTGGTKYVTQSASGSTSSTVTWSFTWTAPVAGTGQVTFYGAFCVGKSNTKLSTLVVGENAVLPLAVAVTANPTSILLGTTSQLNAVPSGGTGTYTYAWTSVPAGFTSALQNPVVSPTATTQYVVTVGDGSGTVQGNVTVTVTLPVPLAVTVSATPSSITSGQSSQLNASPSGGSGSYTYSWTSVPAGFTSTLQNPLVWPTVTTQYNVTVGDGSGTVQGNATVTVSALPLSATASATPSTVCAGQNVQLNVVPAGGSGTYTYSWTSVPAGFTSSIQNPVVTPAASTQYIAHVGDGTASAEASTSVTVNQPATAAAGNDTTFAFATIQVPLNGIASGYSGVLWTTSGTGTFSAASSLTGNYLPSATDKTGGNVTLTLTASPLSPCSATATDTRVITFDGPIGIADGQTIQAAMVLSPNPTTGLFRLRVSGLDNMQAVVTISDITGRKIFQNDLNASVNRSDQYDLSGYPKGIYLVKIQAGNQSLVRKLVVE
ncbi:MAG: T9SS type A sorting domain-containing protein [Bacteroidetes bacterium]|nr:T9SS type A sorting domain-containing protein [Bacteroidota bacterium]